MGGEGSRYIGRNRRGIIELKVPRECIFSFQTVRYDFVSINGLFLCFRCILARMIKKVLLNMDLLIRLKLLTAFHYRIKIGLTKEMQRG